MRQSSWATDVYFHFDCNLFNLADYSLRFGFIGELVVVSQAQYQFRDVVEKASNHIFAIADCVPLSRKPYRVSKCTHPNDSRRGLAFRPPISDTSLLKYTPRYHQQARDRPSD